MKKWTIDLICDDLRAMGIKQGDVVFVKADVARIGYIKEAPRTGVLEALIRVVGPAGTVVISAFTPSYFLPTIKYDHCFFSDTPPNTGGLARVMVRHPDAQRSLHPTNSFAAIGPDADRILKGHDETAPSYLPMRQLIDLPSKSLVIGCVDTSPGFTTTHWAQFQLKQSVRNIFSGWVGSYYMRDGQRRLFKRGDMGGHNPGAYKLYAHYVSRGLLNTGRVGDAYAVWGDTRELYQVDLEVMKDNPRFILCSDPRCFDCRGTWLYNKRDMPLYYLFVFPRVVMGKLNLFKKK